MLRLGHITDLHLRHSIPGSSLGNKRRSRVVPTLLNEALTCFADQNVDVIALTGDIVDVPLSFLEPTDYWQGFPLDYSLAAKEDYLLVKKALVECGIPYIILPGNHDHIPTFNSVFTEDQTMTLKKGCKLFRFDDRTWDWRIPHRFDRERKNWESALEDPDPSPQVHLQHYVITPECNERWPHTYFDGVYMKQQMVNRGGLILSLSGHYHPGTPLIKEGTCYFTTTPCFAEFPHTIRVFEIENNEVNMDEIPIRKKPVGSERPVVFLDRDGVITRERVYETGPSGLSIVPGAGNAILRLHQAGFAVVVISNQSAVGKGRIPLTAVEMTHEYMNELLWKETGSTLSQPDAIYFEMATKKNPVHIMYSDTSRLKPAIHMPEEAIKTLGLTRENMWFVGDRASDIACGNALGAQTILISEERGDTEGMNLVSSDRPTPSYVERTLEDAVTRILKNLH